LRANVRNRTFDPSPAPHKIGHWHGAKWTHSSELTPKNKTRKAEAFAGCGAPEALKGEHKSLNQAMKPQAMKTAMKASKKIKTAPAAGMITGMCLTTPSTGSFDEWESL
jgi:hypothetical protein